MQEFTECSARQGILEQQLIDYKELENRGDKLGLGPAGPGLGAGLAAGMPVCLGGFCRLRPLRQECRAEWRCLAGSSCTRSQRGAENRLPRDAPASLARLRPLALSGHGRFPASAAEGRYVLGMTLAEYVCDLLCEPGGRVAMVLIPQSGAAGQDGKPPKVEQRVWWLGSISSGSARILLGIREGLVWKELVGWSAQLSGAPHRRQP